MRLPSEILQGILARAALALLRVYLGVIFLIAAIRMLQQDFTPAFTGLFEDVGVEQSPLPYRELLLTVVLPNVRFFAGLFTWGELLAGVLLILGLMTRLSAAAALLFLLNYLVVSGAWSWTSSNNDSALAAIFLALIIGAAGRTFGLDSMLARRWPRSPLW